MSELIAVGCDHGGFELKAKVLEHLVARGYRTVDLGTDTPESTDYPPFAAAVARAVQSGQAARGVVICGSGIGVCITANRFHGIRAALAPTVEHARLGREHNNANVLCLGERLTPADQALAILDVFLDTEFAGGRHERRIQGIDQVAQDQA